MADAKSEIGRLVIVTGTVPVPGDGYERVTEFVGGPGGWDIQPITGGYQVTRGKLRGVITGVPCVAWLA